MNDRLETRKCRGVYNFLTANKLFLAGLAVFVSLGVSSLAIYTRTAATQELDSRISDMKNDTSVGYRKEDQGYASLETAIAAIRSGHESDAPQAQTKLVRGTSRDLFGGSVAISGDTAIIGANAYSGGAGRGIVYVLTRSGTTWNFSQELTASDGVNGDSFGHSVAISGDTLIIGANRDDSQKGSAYVFVGNGSSWSQQQKLTLPTGTGFGTSVAILGNTAVIGGGGSTGSGFGAASVFTRNGSVWSLQQSLTPSDGPGTFGLGVAISGETVIAGPYVFVRSGTTWTQQQKLIPTEPAPFSNGFGESVAISGNTAIVGAYAAQVGTNFSQGAAFVFKRNGTVWSQTQRLTAPDGAQSGYFGFRVAILGEMLVVGAPFDDGQGTAHVFYSCGDEPWTYRQKLLAFDRGNEWEFGPNGDEFGHSVAVSADTVMVGAWTDDAAPNINSFDRGAVYVTPRADLPPALPCETEIIVNITSDLADVDIQDDVCDVDTGQTGQQCSLRAAIQTANAKDGPDEIKFNIPGAGPHTISPIDILPPVTEKVSIDATTQPGYSASPLIELRGSGQTYGLGFSPGSNNSSVAAFAINRFQAAIAFQSGGNKVERCYLGMSPDGAAAGTASEQLIGIDIRGATANNNTIGNSGVLRNVISNNSIGLAISQGATGNKVFGNRIGTNVAGTNAIANVVGVVIDGSSGNRIGDTVVGNGNLISGNSGVGIAINAGSTDNLIARNLIGTNATGTEALANGNGIFIDASNNNSVGSVTGDHGNTISGNTTAGVIVQVGSSNNTIVGNRIGTNATGTVAIPNQTGVFVDSSTGNTIGDLSTSTRGNLISGNSQYGLVLQNSSSTNRISNNSIGTTLNGAAVLPNGEVGVFLTAGALNNFIEKNAVGGHTLTTGSAGIGFSANAGPNNSVTGNFIGVVRTGTAAISNKFGIVSFADGQIIGTQSNGNIIGHNQKAGIFVASLEGTNPVVENNRIEYNFIGTNGSADIGNSEEGILYEGNVENNPISFNIVSGNTRFGIALTDNVRSNLIKGNFIGTNSSGTSAIPNGGGLWVRQARDNTIESNLVSGNSLGILVGTNAGFGESAERVQAAGAMYTTGNRFFGNTIGLNAARTAAIPGCSIGIAIGENARNNLIGTPTGAHNFISGNSATIGYGILLGTLSTNATEDSLPQFNTFQKNLVGLGGDLQTTISNTKGFVLLGAANNTIGGETDATANIIVASTQEGISIIDRTRDNIFLRSFLGVLPPGFGSRPGEARASSPNLGTYGNGSHGIFVANGAQRNTLGGTTPATGMVISGNGGNGIHIASTAGNGNRIGANSISGNTLPGIDLGGTGLTPNDPTDADAGPNNLQNYPTMTLSLVGGDLIVNYQVDSAPANSAYGSGGIKVDFYEADLSGQGSTLLGTDQYLLSDYTNGTPGTRQKNLGNAVALGIVAGDKLTATATDADGNSSEFTPAVNAPGGAPGFEGDVAPRPNGDGSMGSTDITQLRRFVSGLDTPNPSSNELQRIDCAPRSTFGDGVVNSTDVVQGRRYIAGLDPMTAAGGPASRGLVPDSIFVGDRNTSFEIFQREVRIGDPEFSGANVFVPVELTSQGNEVAISFTLEYDPSILANPRIVLGEDAPARSVLTVNTNNPGRIGILIDSTEPMTASPMPQHLLRITFEMREDGAVPAVSFTESLASKGISDAAGNSLTARYLDGDVTFPRK